MGARRYGIYLRVFDSIAHELAQRPSKMWKKNLLNIKKKSAESLQNNNGRNFQCT